MAKKVVNENDMEQVTVDTKKLLDAQDKVKVRIPMSPELKQKLEAEEKAGKKIEWPSHSVQINGYIYQIQLGKSVEVPESVAEILEQAGLI